MSLYKQLWFGIAILMILALGGSFVLSSFGAQQYLEAQLFRKNNDDATALALRLATEPSDPVHLELVISAAFDAGHYHFIHLVDLEGNTLAARYDDRATRRPHDWLARLFPIEAKPGVAKVSQGWHQIGTLTLSSDTRFAYEQLWQNSLWLLWLFLALALLACLSGAWLLRWILRPLRRAIVHAEAIGARRFIQSDIPFAQEFAALIRAMNRLSGHVKSMLEAESEKLEQWRQETQHDTTTGLLNREPLLNRLRSLLDRMKEPNGGAVILVRIVDLFGLNQRYGRITLDGLLSAFGETLYKRCEETTTGVSAGRLNGSDFLIVYAGAQPDTAQTRHAVLEELAGLFRARGLEDSRLIGVSYDFNQGENLSELMRRLDDGLSTVDPEQPLDTRVLGTHILGDTQNKIDEAPELVAALDRALNEHHFSLELFPVLSHLEDPLHFEAPLRLHLEDGRLLPAREFLGTARKHDWGKRLDRSALTLALDTIAKREIPIGINLSEATLSDQHARQRFIDLMKNANQETESLWLEFPEHAVFRHLDEFRDFCEQIKSLPCKIGIEHLGHSIAHIGQLHDLGLDFVKVDSALTREIETNPSNQVFLRGVLGIVHALGVMAIAEGVENKETWHRLKKLGFDGGTGPLFESSLD